MNKLGTLLKNYFKVYIGAFGRRKNKKQYLGGGALLLIVGILFLVMFSSMAYGIIIEAIKIGEPEVALYALVTMGLFYTLLVVILKFTNSKKTSDMDLLSSLPIKKSVIVFSKILKEYIFDFFPILFTMMPGFICYYILVDNASISIIFLGILVIILLTFLANALSILLKSFVFFVTKRLKNAEVIQTIINVIIIIVFLICYYYLMNSINDINSGMAQKLLDFFFIKNIVNTLLAKDLSSVIILIAICLIPFIIATYIYLKTIEKTNKKSYSTKKDLVYKKENIIKTMLKKELNRYLRSTLYVVNTIVGGIMLILFSALIGVFGLSFIKNLFSQYGFGSVSNSIQVIIILVASVLISTSCTTSSSISIEGKNFWILKANPISEKSIFLSKILLNILIGIIPCFLSSVILSFILGFSYFIFIFIILAESLIMTSFIGLKCNLKYNRFDWTDEAEVIKQGMSTLITLVLSPLFSILYFVIYVLGAYKFISSYYYLTLIIVINVIFIIVLYKILMKKGIKEFQDISC